MSEFLQSFGADGPAQIDRLFALGNVYDLMRACDADELAGTLSVEYPKKSEATKLKVSLFGLGHERWWDASELAVAMAVIRCEGRGFDLKALKFGRRLRDLIVSGHAEELVLARPRPGSSRFRSVLVTALVPEANSDLVAQIYTADPDLAKTVLKEKPDLMDRGEMWSTLTDEQARSIAGGGLPASALSAAVIAGRFDAIQDQIPPLAALTQLAGAHKLDALRALLKAHPLTKVASGAASDDLRIRVAAAGGDAGDISELLRALDAARAEVDETWMRAAVQALVTTKGSRQDQVLEVVFGPLHNAMTENIFPDDLWDLLGQVAPFANDPALRLRRLLVNRARSARWSREALQRSLRDAGPHVGQLKRDLEGDSDDPFVVVVKAALKAVKRLLG